MDRAALHSQLAAAVQIVLHVHRRPDGSRGLREIGLVHRNADGRVHIAPAWHESAPAPAFDDLARLLDERLDR